MASASISHSESLMIEISRKINFPLEAKNEMTTLELYKTVKNIIDSCKTEKQFETCNNLLKLIENIDASLSKSLFYYFTVKSGEIVEIKETK